MPEKQTILVDLEAHPFRMEVIHLVRVFPDSGVREASHEYVIVQRNANGGWDRIGTDAEHRSWPSEWMARSAAIDQVAREGYSPTVRALLVRAIEQTIYTG